MVRERIGDFGILYTPANMITWKIIVTTLTVVTIRTTFYNFDDLRSLTILNHASEIYSKIDYLV